MARKSKSDGLLVQGLGKSYRQKVVLRDVNLALKRGEVAALLGPNGAGKTTCFYSIAGIVSPDKGSVFVEGKDATQLPMYRRARLGLGYLPQEPSIFRGLNVEKNILSIAELWCENKDAARARTLNLMEEFTITHLKDSPALALSGGERRRVEIARCLASDPKYVLLDEPFAGVDPIAVNDIRTLVAQLKRKKIGVLITDHNVRETLKIVDRAYILHDGMVMMSGTPKQVIANKDVRKVYLGQDFEA
ncbi:MAG: LPS export ABC transporter ATP-binding protein [Pseudomonadota bacterium]